MPNEPKKYARSHIKQKLMQNIYAPDFEAYLSDFDIAYEMKLFRNPANILREHAREIMGPIVSELFNAKYGQDSAFDFSDTLYAKAEQIEISKKCGNATASRKTNNRI